MKSVVAVPRYRAQFFSGYRGDATACTRGGTRRPASINGDDCSEPHSQPSCTHVRWFNHVLSRRIHNQRTSHRIAASVGCVYSPQVLLRPMLRSCSGRSNPLRIKNLPQQKMAITSDFYHVGGKIYCVRDYGEIKKVDWDRVQKRGVFVSRRDLQ